MFKFVIALFTALLIAVIGGVAIPAAAHDCGCQESNSGPGSASSGSGSDNSGSGSSGPDNSGPGNACHDNSGPGNADDECPPDDPGDDPGDDTGDDTTNDNGNTGAGVQTTGTRTVVLGAQASAPQAAAEVPTAVNAGLTDGEEAPSALAGLAILLGLAMTFAALVRRRAHG